MINIHSRRPRITAIPAGHPYVKAVIGPFADLRPDPIVDPDDPGRWWPHPHLEPGGGAGAARGADIVHVHFGFEHRNADQLADFADEVHAGGAKLVVTVHDIDCPHVLDQEKYRRALRVLVRRADAVITLTESAADECEEQFGVRPRVIPHPPIVDADAARALMERAPRRLDVSLSYKNVRPNVVDDPRLPRAITAALADVPGARLRIHVFPEVLDPANERHRPALARGLRELDDDPALSATVVLDASGPKSDADLHRGLAECVAAVLPYAFGTHSGWLEMCRDLGLRVIVPGVGHYADQADRPGAVIPADMTDPDAVAAAVREAVLVARRDGPLPRAEDPTRTTDAVARAHRDLYLEVLGW